MAGRLDHPFVRTFHARNGRMTETVRRQLDEVLPRYRLADGPIDPTHVFGREAPLVVEVGAGHGAAAIAHATTFPGLDILAIEVHRPGVAHIVQAIDQDRIPNLRVVAQDATTVLSERLAETSIDAVHLFFPDPWPKRAQHKRRFVQPEIVDLVASRLKEGGVFRTATDHSPYVEQIDRVLDEHPSFVAVDTERPAWRPTAGYEDKAIEAGRTVHERCHRRITDRT